MAKRISDEISDELRKWCESENGTGCGGGCGGFITKKISDELREFADAEVLSAIQISDLKHMAKRIDAEMVELPKDRDGKPIHVGETVYGEDGKAWHVRGVVLCSASVTERRFSVKAIGDSGQWRGLKPEWLTHERPDSWERIAYDLDDWTAVLADCDVDAAHEFAERIRKLADKEG